LIFKDKSGKVMSKKKFCVNKDDAQLNNNRQAQEVQQEIIPNREDQWIVTYLEKVDNYQLDLFLKIQY